MFLAGPPNSVLLFLRSPIPSVSFLLACLLLQYVIRISCPAGQPMLAQVQSWILTMWPPFNVMHFCLPASHKPSAEDKRNMETN